MLYTEDLCFTVIHCFCRIYFSSFLRALSGWCSSTMERGLNGSCVFGVGVSLSAFAIGHHANSSLCLPIGPQLDPKGPRLQRGLRGGHPDLLGTSHYIAWRTTRSGPSLFCAAPRTSYSVRLEPYGRPPTFVLASFDPDSSITSCSCTAFWHHRFTRRQGCRAVQQELCPRQRWRLRRWRTQGSRLGVPARFGLHRLRAS